MDEIDRDEDDYCGNDFQEDYFYNKNVMVLSYDDSVYLSKLKIETNYDYDDYITEIYLKIKYNKITLVKAFKQNMFYIVLDDKSIELDNNLNLKEFLKIDIDNSIGVIYLEINEDKYINFINRYVKLLTFS